MRKPESYSTVWDAIADTPGQAANLRARAELMRQIAALVKKQGWTQVEAAQHCGVTQPRINDLLRGRVSRFSHQRDCVLFYLDNRRACVKTDPRF